MPSAAAWIGNLLGWLDSHAAPVDPNTPRRIRLLRVLPFVALHLLALSAIWVGASPFAVSLAVLLYLLRMFGITAFYHRYFSHRTFQTGRLTQLVGAILGNAAAQRGPLWWAAHHRHHHAHADQPEDAHSPAQHGFMWSHLLWFLADGNFRTDLRRVKDLSAFPELVFLDRFDALVPAALGLCLYAGGEWLATRAPTLGADGPQLLVWGLGVSTVAVHHATFTINSLSHLIGRRRYPTNDRSRNNWLLAILTLGEGWHNNHHHFPGTARQGFFWWEYDPTWWGLRLLQAVGLVRHPRPVPARVRRPPPPLARPEVD